ncbi:hypothetical protein PENTCL1PPCAC_9800 [Pristionchus entomophagus]|uniref:RING-type domain-containing protein n=1 Tax=Pristionchus entomophagus TaxID=358040 RepID=A0AAV5SXY5_9BILA|nr:hypothetical protein PENTCL1PPCAC_9800 [Pristionchus entomophagus]
MAPGNAIAVASAVLNASPTSPDQQGIVHEMNVEIKDQLPMVKEGSPLESPTVPDDKEDVEMREEEEQQDGAVEEAGDAAAAAGDAAAAMDEAAAAAAEEKPVAAPAAVAAAAAEEAVEEEQQCLICFDVLMVKRAVTAIPCMHSMHRTCALAWLETRTDERTQSCCSCRAQVEMIADIETGEELRAVPAYGTLGQPTRALIDNVYEHGKNEWLTSYLRGESQRTIFTLSEISEEARIARMVGKGEAYLADIEDESLKLQRRMAILEELEQDWGAIWQAQYEAEQEARAARAAAAAERRAAEALAAQQAADAAQAAAAAAAAAAQADAAARQHAADALNAMLEEVAPAAAEAAANAAAAAPQEDAVMETEDEAEKEAAAVAVETKPTADAAAALHEDTVMETEEKAEEAAAPAETSQPTAAVAADEVARDENVVDDELSLDETNFF